MRGKMTVIVMVALIGLALVLPTGEAQAHGWWAWGPAAFAGGLLIGSALAQPWYAPWPGYYAYPPPAVVYAAPPAYYVPSPAYAYPAVVPSTRGRWVEVPGQSINGVWVPPHKAWAPY